MKGPRRVTVTVTANLSPLRANLRRLHRLMVADVTLCALLEGGVDEAQILEPELARREAFFRDRGLSPLEARARATESLAADAIQGRLQ